MKACACCGAGPTWTIDSPRSRHTDTYCPVEFMPAHEPHHQDCTLHPDLLEAQDRAAKARLCAPNPAMRPYLSPPRADPGYPQVGGTNLNGGRGVEKAHERIVAQIMGPAFNPAMRRLLAKVR